MVANLTKVVIAGHGFGEIWTISHHQAPANWASADELNTFVGTYINQLTASAGWPQLLADMSVGQFVDSVTAYHYPDSTAPAAYSAQGNIVAPNSAGSSTVHNPLQTSCVATLRTARSGASNRGRMYLPATGIAIGTGALFANADTDALILTVERILLEATDVINTMGHTGAHPVVYSPTLNVVNTITRVTIDNRPDIQRRRAESLSASHVSSGTVIS